MALNYTRKDALQFVLLFGLPTLSLTALGYAFGAEYGYQGVTKNAASWVMSCFNATEHSALLNQTTVPSGSCHLLDFAVASAISRCVAATGAATVGRDRFIGLFSGLGAGLFAGSVLVGKKIYNDKKESARRMSYEAL